MDEMTFIRFEDRGEAICAIFHIGDGKEEAWDRPSLERRVANLERYGGDTRHERGVLAHWPAQEPGREAPAQGERGDSLDGCNNH